MKRPYEERLPEDLQGIASKFREDPLDVGPIKLDQLKQRAMAQAAKPHRRRTFMKTRLATFLAALTLLGGSAAALALSSSDSHPNVYGGAAAAQYHHHHHHHHHHHCHKTHGKHHGVCHKKHHHPGHHPSHHVHHSPAHRCSGNGEGGGDNDCGFEHDLARSAALISEALGRL